MVGRLVAAAVLLLAGATAHAQPTPEELRAKYEKEHDEAIGLLRAQAYDEIDGEQALTFFDREGARVILVTKPGHPAHPAVVIRRTDARGGHLSIDSEGIGRGDQTALRAWISELDAQARQDIGPRREGRTP